MTECLKSRTEIFSQASVVLLKDILFFFFFFESLYIWHPTPVLLPGKSHGRRSLWAAVPGVEKSRHD